MPATKSDITLFSAVTLDAGADAVRNTGWVDLRTTYGGIFMVKITNDSTRLDQGVQVRAEISKDQIAGNEFPFGCREIAGQEADEVSRFTFRIPPEIKFARISIIEADQDADADVFMTRLDQV